MRVFQILRQNNEFTGRNRVRLLFDSRSAARGKDLTKLVIDLTKGGRLKHSHYLNWSRHIIDKDRYPLSPRIQTLKSILDDLRPEPAREPLPPPKHYEPPSRGRYRRRG